MNYEEVVHTLRVANELQRTPAQQHAEQQLKAWEIVPGFNLALQDVYLDGELPLQVRWLAVICFKNSIEKHWRLSRQNAISKEEKQRIRARLFAGLKEKNSQLTIQNAHSVGRIVRFDFPAEWPSLFDDVATNLEELVFSQNDLVSTHNLLIILNQVIKAVAAVRIGRARQALQAKAPTIMLVLLKLYVKFFQMWTGSLDLSTMELCYLCLKCLRRIIPEGFDQPHTNHDIVEFLRLSVEHLQGLVSKHESYLSDLLERYVKSYSKLYVSLINTNPTSFVLLPCSQEIVSTFLSLLESKAEIIHTSTEENDFWGVLALKGFMILKRLINYIYKKGAVTLKPKNDRREVDDAMAKLSQTFFTPQVVQHLCDLIINWYIKLSPSDLESWTLEPEEWCNEELSSSWEYQVRPCAENFFQDLIKHFKGELTEFLLAKFSSGLAGDVLVSDATLCTFQLSASVITDSVDFNRLLAEVFVPAALNDSLENKIIRRRVCLIVSEWISVDCNQGSRVLIYKLLIELLQPSKVNDKVVKLTAVQTLRAVLEDWDFNKAAFQPYLHDFISLCIGLLPEMELTELKLYVLNTLSTIIEKCNPLIDAQTLISILNIVPGHWEGHQTNEESILKTSLLRILRNLVIALNENSPETHVITIPLVRSCVNENSELYTLLSEDGYDLWLALVQYLPLQADNKHLLELFPLIHQGLVSSTEILPTILQIIRSYALISSDLIKSDVGQAIFETLAGYLPTMRDDAFAIFISLVDILFLQRSDEIFVQGLVNSGLFDAMLRYVLDENQSIVCANKILLVVSRLAFSAPEALFQVLSVSLVDSVKFLETWLQYYINNGNPRSKKVNLLAFLSVAAYAIPKNYPVFPQKFGDILKNTFVFLEEVNETAEGNLAVYNQNLTYEDIDDYCYLDADIKPHGEKLRYQQLTDTRDPLLNVNLQQYTKQTLVSLQQQLSPEDLRQLLLVNDQYTTERVQSLA